MVVFLPSYNSNMVFYMYITCNAFQRMFAFNLYHIQSSESHKYTVLQHQVNSRITMLLKQTHTGFRTNDLEVREAKKEEAERMEAWRD